MAMCEQCGKNGYVPFQMFVQFDKFVGPCCKEAGAHSIQPPSPPASVHVLVPVKATDEVEYGLELSNKIGIRAYANYHGLQLSYERSPEQLKKWAEKQGLIEQQAR